MVPGPVVVHVLEEGRVEDLDLRMDTGEGQPACEEQAQDPDPDPLSRAALGTHLVLVHAQELLHWRVGAGGTGRGYSLSAVLQPGAVDGSTYNRIWPVDRALVIHTRSRVLKGTRTKLTLAARFLALSGYMKWWVVRLPASSSKPTVGARFILGTKQIYSLFNTCPHHAK